MTNSILIWGLGHDFWQLQLDFQRELDRGNIRILAIVDRNTELVSPWQGVPIVSPIEIKNYKFDYVVIASKKYFFDIRMELLNLEIDEQKILDGAIFHLRGFDFCEFQRLDRLRDRIFFDHFQDNTYADLLRTYRKNNVRIELGRKSYVADSYCEGDAENGQFSEIRIGNYTAISWGICWELGLNLDHDYHRVCNYGVTHIGAAYDAAFGKFEFGGDNICIGSDVWIGRGSHIKSGISIGNGAVVAANSIVVDSVEPYAIVGGNPARLIKYRFDREIICKLQAIKWWSWDNDKIQRNLFYFKDIELFVKRFYR